tara:strand:+ start:56 stop:1351 length:1296 start_codon:yes stop_codon:yes gene_type:complete
MKYIILISLLIKCTIGLNQNISVDRNYKKHPEKNRENIHTFFVNSENPASQKKFEINMRKKMKYSNSSIGNRYAHFLYYDSDGYGEIVLITFDTDQMSKTVIRTKAPMSFASMNPVGDQIFYQRSSSTPKLKYINWKTGEQQVTNITIEGVNPNSIKITSIKQFEKDETLYLSINGLSNYTPKNYILKIDNSGKTIKKWELKEQKSHIVDYSITNSSNENEFFISGTYSGKEKDKSTQMFFGVIKNDTIKEYSSHRYILIDDFFNNSKEETKKKADRILKRNLHINQNKDLDYNIVCHNIKQLIDGYLFVGDAYYPTSSGSSGTGLNGVHYSSSSFEGNQYSHICILKLDFQGNIIWNKVISTDTKTDRNIKTPTKQSYTKINDDQTITLRRIPDMVTGLVIPGSHTVKLNTKYFSDLTTLKLDINGNIIE